MGAAGDPFGWTADAVRNRIAELMRVAGLPPEAEQLVCRSHDFAANNVYAISEPERLVDMLLDVEMAVAWHVAEIAALCHRLSDAADGEPLLRAIRAMCLVRASAAGTFDQTREAARLWIADWLALDRDPRPGTVGWGRRFRPVPASMLVGSTP